MKVKFTNHAQANLIDRKIEASRVVDTLRAPESTKSGFEGKMIRRKKFGKRTLEVIYIQEKGRSREPEFLVITAYYL